MQTDAFLMKQSRILVSLGPLRLTNGITQLGKNGFAGVSKGKVIYFKHL